MTIQSLNAALLSLSMLVPPGIRCSWPSWNFRNSCAEAGRDASRAWPATSWKWHSWMSWMSLKSWSLKIQILIEPRGHARGPRGHARGLGHAAWAADPAEAAVNGFYARSDGLRHRPRTRPHRHLEPLPGARSRRRPDPRSHRRPDPRPHQPPRSCKAEQRTTFANGRVRTQLREASRDSSHDRGLKSLSLIHI